MIKPITPDEVITEKIASIPEFVIEVFNKLIGQGWNGTYSTVKMEDAATGIRNHSEFEHTNKTIYEKGWLDVEPIYRKAGWIVIFDRPGYNESFDSYYTFRKGE